MKKTVKALMAAAAIVVAGTAAAQITLYEGEGFRGRAITTNDRIWNLGRAGMNDRVSSIVVERGRWEVCEHERFEGRCVILRRGSYPSLNEFGLNNQISSVRPADNRRRWEEMEPAVTPQPGDWRRRPREEIFDVPVTSVRAVMGPPNQRCWVERQQVVEPQRGSDNVGGAIIGGLVGGILGHQVGGGTGKDLATAGGAVAGAVVGSNLASNNSSQVVSTRDVQRCQQVPSQTPSYYDVTYFFNGVEHHVQMQAPPGRTIAVNGRGEPRM